MKPTLVRDNVHALPVNYVPDIAAALRAFAELIDEGAVTARKLIVVHVDEDGLLDFAAFGEPFNSAEGLGLLDLAKAKIINGTWRQM